MAVTTSLDHNIARLYHNVYTSLRHTPTPPHSPTHYIPAPHVYTHTHVHQIPLLPHDYTKHLHHNTLTHTHTPTDLKQSNLPAISTTCLLTCWSMARNLDSQKSLKPRYCHVWTQSDTYTDTALHTPTIILPPVVHTTSPTPTTCHSSP